MSDSGPLPELVIAIDFGMTCTGVAFCNVATGEQAPRCINRWPGSGRAVVDKVPTILVYPKNSTTPSSWGFYSEHHSEQMSQDKDLKEWFKTYLDEDKLRRALRDPNNHGICPASIQEVEKLYCDFLGFIYQTIRTNLQGELANRWEDACIEFIFSVPTTWKPVPTVERFRSIIRRAGFGGYSNHRAEIGLTEAEAAAVHTARRFPKLFKERDVLLVCDVGGGTTDLNVLRVVNTVGESLNLEQMDVVQGATIGSVQLDEAFENSVKQRLYLANQLIPMGLQPQEFDQISWKMAKEREYQNAKCEYGAWDDETEFFTVAIPGLRRDYTNENAWISNGEMSFRRDEIRSFFDAQIERLYELLDGQLTRLLQNFPEEQVALLVLSGGLGNSKYVFKRLQDRYERGGARFPNSRSLVVKVAPEPQLVVCKGIVADRVHKLKTGKSVLGWRCSRASYGTLSKVLYNPQNPEHFGKIPVKDEFDGKLYILECITWFIKQGEPVSTDYPIVKKFSRKCAPATQFNPNPARVFKTDIITCNLEKDKLPLVMNSSCSKICDISSDLSSVPLSMFKLKNRHWWNTRAKYHRIEYVIKVVLGPADLRFELWHDGKKLSNDNPIRVEWFSAEPPPEITPRDTFPVWQESAPEVRAASPSPLNGQYNHSTFALPRRPIPFMRNS
ncbi:hypothetical protein N431DRAFT_552160 [Stipitochalara longipes BDJ]|nr:hypothetical protein N431DRAFT_552160 [Stipitochalara longipes BDJ]